MSNHRKLNKSLFAAAERGDLNALKRALAEGADINATTDVYLDEGQTPLFVAANQNQYQCVVELLKSGADVHVRTSCSQTPDRNGGTVLHVHLLNDELKDTRVLEALLDAGAEIDASMTDGLTPLGQAARTGNKLAVKLLIKRGSTAHLVNGINSVVLLEAARSGSVDSIKLLLDNGTPVDISDDFNMTPLMPACKEGHAEIVRLLLEHGASVQKMDARGRTALHHACDFANCARSDKAEEMSIAIGKMLIAAGAKLDVMDKDGKRPIDYLDYIDSDASFRKWIAQQK